VTDDTLRDELAEALYRQANPIMAVAWDDPDWGHRWRAKVEVLLPVVRRYADAQVAAERERIAAAIMAVPDLTDACEFWMRDKAASIARGQP
jgi:hypothetical protein